MNHPPFIAIFYHAQYGLSYQPIHTQQEFLRIAQFKNSSWAKLFHAESGKTELESFNPEARIEPIP